MSRTLQSTSTKSTEPEFVWPEYTPSLAHRNFLKRLKRARIERGLSIEGMSDEVGLTFRLAHEFEDLVTPLPFCHLEVWCQIVGVPFDDYLAIYRAEMAELEAQMEAGQKTPCIANTEASAPEAPAPAFPRSLHGCDFLNPLRAAFAHIVRRLLSRFSAPKETSE